ncbi:MAG: anthranilate phosphoribosyltransferase [Gammaproteobacteria bacterium]
MDIKQALQTVLNRQHLSSAQMRETMLQIMTGNATDAQLAGFLIALRCKGETVDEIAAAASVLRELATKVPVNGAHVIDTCGTGGDGANTFNISTTCAFVVAAAGGQVAKHGNRAASSRSGSADVLEAAGVNLMLTPAQVAACVAETGIGFLFAPQHHGAMKHTSTVRKELGVRTLFNLLGPLSNPANAAHQLLGVFADAWLEPVAQVLKKLGSEHVLVVHAADGLDEISIAAETRVAELKHGEIDCYSIAPEQFGLQRAPLSALAVDGVQSSLNKLLAVLDNQPGPARDIVLLNAGAAIYAADLADTLAGGIAKAAEALANGAAKARFEALKNVSKRFTAV